MTAMQNSLMKSRSPQTHCHAH